MADKLNINKKTICQILHKDLWKRKICAQSSTHTDSWMSRNNGDSHHAKTSSGFVKIILHFLISKVKTALKRKKLQDAEDI
jgi:hypothetical protein